MSEIKVNSIKGVGASAAAITINNTDGTCTANLSNRQGKNLVVNGACLIAQRGTSSTSEGYQTLDRFPIYVAGTDESPTQAQVDVASGTTPYTLGFRKALKITNGNQTSGANTGSTQYIWLQYKIEAQDIANSGWNYTSTSSFITLSFWVKSSVAQTFKGYIETIDGTKQQYPFETGSLSADTWTKITKKISGNSNLTFDNNNEEGFKLSIVPFISNNKTESTVTEDAWGTYNSSARMKDSTTTWYTTNDATFELTGVQLEVGSFATDFEHRSFAQELALCQRYYQKLDHRRSTGSSGDRIMYYEQIGFNTTMRAAPSLVAASAYNSDSGVFVTYSQGDYSTTTSGCTFRHSTTNQVTVSGTDGAQYHNILGRVHLSAEL